MGRLPGRRFWVALLLIATVVAVLWAIRYKGLDWAVKISAIAVVALAFTGPLMGPGSKITSWLRRPQPPTPEEIASARNHLRAALSGAWSEGESEVYEDVPMRVGFAEWAGAFDSHARYDPARVDAPAAAQPLTGDFDSVADSFSQKPRYRRVVLGEPGAGKTVLVTELQRQLVEASRPDDPLPVIVPVAAWQPDTQSLLDWLAEQLAADYGWLSVTHARALVARGMVLPILDGLDEMPGWLRPIAIARINKHHVYRPLVITSREHEYLVAVRQNRGTPVRGSVAVVVQPLRLEATQAYLDPTGSGPWASVLDEMNPSDALARVLTNPLMLSLARVEYEGQSPDNLILISNQESIERLLLDEFVPTMYEGDSGPPTARQFRWTAQQARCWLGHLAWHNYKQYRNSQQTLKQTLKHEQETTEEVYRTGASAAPVLAWWQISNVAGWWRRLGIGLRAAVLCSVAVALWIWVLERHGNLRHGAYSGPPNFTDLLLGGPVGRLIRPTVHTLAMAVKKGLGSDSAAVSHVIDDIFSPFVIILAAALFVIIAAVVLPDSSYVPVRLYIRPMAILGQALKACFYLFAFTALMALLLLYFIHSPVSVAIFFGLRTTWITLLAVSLLGLISVPGWRRLTWSSDASGNLSPRESLRLDRQADAVVTLSKRSAVAVAVWLFCGPQIAAAYVVYAITATVVALTVGGQRRCASRSYVDARIWLTALGWAPWRTMAFLADASRRGVLRQVGAAYQFRHIRLLGQVPEWRALPTRVDVWRSHLTKATNQVREQIRQWRDETADWIRKDAVSRRQMAQASPDGPPRGFVEALRNLDNALHRSEDERVQTPIGDFLEACQALAETDPAAFGPDLARILRVYVSKLSLDMALRMAREATDAYRERVQNGPAGILPGLADSLSDLADGLWRYWPEESVSAQEKAVVVWRELADRGPARFLSPLTSALDILVSRLQELGRPEDELAAIRAALDAYQKRAERIAKIRRRIAEAHLAGLLQSRQKLTPVSRAFARARSEERKSALGAARKAAAACGKLAEPDPAEFLLDLAEVARGLAVELKAAGRRREARILANEANRLRSQDRRSVDTTDRKAREVPPLDRMNDLALRLWKLGNQQEALTVGQISHRLAPQRQDGAAAATRRRDSPVPSQARLREELARLREELARLREELARRREETEVRRWKADVRSWHTSLQNSPNDWRQLYLGVALEKHSDALDTLAFRRRIAHRDQDADDATIQAVEVQQEAVDIYLEMYTRLPLSYRFEVPESLDLLALRLTAASKPEEAAAAADAANEIRASLTAGTLPHPAPTKPAPARSRHAPEAPIPG